MRRLFSRVTLIASSVVWLMAGNIAVGKTGPYAKLIESAAALKPNLALARSVEGVFIQHGVFVLSLDSGIVVPIEKLHGYPTAYLFRGSGSLMFQPHSLTEQVNLKRFYNSETLVETITEALIITTSGLVDEQLDAFAADSTLVPKNDERFKESKNILTNEDANYIQQSVARTILNALPTHYFFAYVNRDKKSDAGEFSGAVIYDPSEYEPYQLYIYKLRDDITRGLQTNSCVDPNASVNLRDDGYDDGDLVSTTQHTMSVRFDRSLELFASDRIKMNVEVDSVSVLDLSLNADLIVDSITIAPGEKLDFDRYKDQWSLWVKLPEAYKKNTQFSITVYYHGKMFVRVEDYTILKSSITWYPAHSYKNKAYYDVTYTYPESMTLAGVGTQSESGVVGDMKTSRWVSGQPIRNASFHIGFFKRKTVETSEGTAKASILYLTPDQVDVIGTDIKQSLDLYTKLYGPIGVDSIIATELPGNHGEAFPGLLHLSSYAFKPSSYDSERFFEEGFIAHEVGHQWWGISVDFQSYRDQWISEGFSEYSSWIYTQIASGDPDAFFKTLERTRTRIVDFGKKDIGKDVPPPAIALGNRARIGGIDIGGWDGYSVFIYSKGAWVVHMLRNLMLDLNTMKEDAFFETMKTFYTTYRGKRATTADFQRVVEQVVGRDMQWFFDQWVYSNQIPAYTWAYSSEKSAEGVYKNKLRIKQHRADPTFRAFIPINVKYDNDTFQRFRVEMVGAEAVLTLPDSVSEIDKVVFNEFMSVLCEQDEESF